MEGGFGGVESFGREGNWGREGGGIWFRGGDKNPEITVGGFVSYGF